MAEVDGCSSLWPRPRLTMLVAMSSAIRRVVLVAHPGAQALDVVDWAEVVASADRVIGDRGVVETLGP